MPALFPKIPHLPGSRTGPSDAHVGAARARAFVERSRADGSQVAPPRAPPTVVVEEKLDGSCVVVVRTADGVEAYGRDGKPASGSKNLGRRLFARWVTAHAGRFSSLLAPGERAAGEWLAIAHGTRYALPHEPFVLFDVLGEGARLSRSALRRRGHDFAVPCILHTGGPLPVDDALRLLGEAGHHGADAAEGLVYREERDDLCLSSCKLVRHGKVDGAWLADHGSGVHLFNDWPRRDGFLRDALAREPEGLAVAPWLRSAALSAR